MSSGNETEEKKNQTNGTTKSNTEAIMVPSSSTSEEPNEEEPSPQEAPDSKSEPEEDVEEEEEVKSSNNSNQQTNEDTVMEDQEQTKNKDKHASATGGVGGSDCYFPTARIKRIIRSECSDLRITQEALLLINKATEQFLEQFCEDVYTIATQERRKAIHYKHLSSTVGKSKRYDFLSDFVPEKMRAEDALVERSLAEA